MKVLTAAEARTAAVLGQAIFPREAKGMPDGLDADIAAAVDDLLAASLPFEQAQLRAVLQLFDRGFGPASGRATRALTDATTSEVTDYLKTWESSTIYTRRMLFEALRAIYLMAYFASERVKREVGVYDAPDIDNPVPYLKLLAEGLSAELAREQLQDAPLPVRANKFLEKPEGLHELADYRADIRESCDFLVVGSGPGGAIAAWELAKSGKKVILVEAGPVFRKADLPRAGGAALATMAWDSGMRTTRGNFIGPTIQARGLGGGTLLNSAICLRALPGPLEAWAYKNGLTGLGVADLAPHYEVVESFMGLKAATVDQMGNREHLFAKGAKAVGLEAVPIIRNEEGCLGSGGCLYGCHNGAKLSHDRRGVPELLALGGQVYTSVEVDRVVTHGGRVAGVEGRIVEPGTGNTKGKVRITAKCTILAAGVIGTPALLQKSGLRQAPIGANLRMHPGTVVSGEFNDVVLPWYGASQGLHVTSLLAYGIKLETLWVDPALMAFRMPAIGKPLKRQITRYRNTATWDAWVSGDDSVGRVRVVAGVPRPQISFDIGGGDVRRLQNATAVLAEMMFAAGATKVFPGIRGMPETLRDVSEVQALRDARLTPTDVPTGSNHAFGTMQMGADPTIHATNSFGAVHGIDDLYVSDSSLLPSSPGANPMLTVWALAHRLGGHLVGKYA